MTLNGVILPLFCVTTLNASQMQADYVKLVTATVTHNQGGHFPDHMKFSDFSLTYPVAWTGKDYPYTA